MLETPVYEYGISSSLCDSTLNRQLEDLQPQSIVDFGAGAGKNGKIARRILQNKVKLVAVEGSKKTANMLSDEGVYDKVFNALIQDWIFEDISKYDLAIFGDVLEHLRPRDIHIVLKQCLSKFQHIVIICPLYDIFQDDSYGNPLEIHQAYITSNFFDNYNCIEKHIRKGKDWTVMNVHIISVSNSLDPIWRRISWKVFHLTMLILQPLGMARPFVNFLKNYFLKFKKILRN